MRHTQLRHDTGETVVISERPDDFLDESPPSVLI